MSFGCCIGTMLSPALCFLLAFSVVPSYRVMPLCQPVCVLPPPRYGSTSFRCAPCYRCRQCHRVCLLPAQPSVLIGPPTIAVTTRQHLLSWPPLQLAPKCHEESLTSLVIVVVVCYNACMLVDMAAQLGWQRHLSYSWTGWLGAGWILPVVS
jgi:hypothetical protein